MKFRPLCIDYEAEALNRLAEEHDRIRAQTLRLPSWPEPETCARVTPRAERLPSSDETHDDFSSNGNGLSGEDVESPKPQTEKSIPKTTEYDAATICRLMGPTVRPEECVTRNIVARPTMAEFRDRMLQLNKKNGGIVVGSPTVLDSMVLTTTANIEDEGINKNGWLPSGFPLISPDQTVPGAMFRETISILLNRSETSDESIARYQVQWEANIRQSCESRTPFLKHALEHISLPGDASVERLVLPEKSLFDSLLSHQTDRISKAMKCDRESVMSEFAEGSKQAALRLNCFHFDASRFCAKLNGGTDKASDAFSLRLENNSIECTSRDMMLTASRCGGEFDAGSLERKQDAHCSISDILDGSHLGASWHSLANGGESVPIQPSFHPLRLDPEPPTAPTKNIPPSGGKGGDSGTLLLSKTLIDEFRESAPSSLRTRIRRSSSLHDDGSGRKGLATVTSKVTVDSLPLQALDALVEASSDKSTSLGKRDCRDGAFNGALVSVTEPNFRKIRVDYDLELPSRETPVEPELTPDVYETVEVGPLLEKMWRECHDPGSCRHQRVPFEHEGERQKRYTVTHSSILKMRRISQMMRHLCSDLVMTIPHAVHEKKPSSPPPPTKPSMSGEREGYLRLLSHAEQDAIRSFVASKPSKRAIEDLETHSRGYPIRSWYEDECLELVNSAGPSTPKRWSRMYSSPAPLVNGGSQNTLKIWRALNSGVSSNCCARTLLLTGCSKKQERFRLSYRGFLSGETVDVQLYESRYLRMLQVVRATIEPAKWHPTDSEATDDHGFSLGPMSLNPHSAFAAALLLCQKSYARGIRAERSNNKTLHSPKSLFAKTRNTEQSSPSNEHLKRRRATPNIDVYLRKPISSILKQLSLESAVTSSDDKPCLSLEPSKADNIFESMEHAGKISVFVRGELLHLFSKAVQLSQAELKQGTKSNTNNYDEEYSWMKPSSTSPNAKPVRVTNAGPTASYGPSGTDECNKEVSQSKKSHSQRQRKNGSNQSSMDKVADTAEQQKKRRRQLPDGTDIAEKRDRKKRKKEKKRRKKNHRKRSSSEGSNRKRRKGRSDTLGTKSNQKLGAAAVPAIAKPLVAVDPTPMAIRTAETLQSRVAPSVPPGPRSKLNKDHASMPSIAEPLNPINPTPVAVRKEEVVHSRNGNADSWKKRSCKNVGTASISTIAKTSGRTSQKRLPTAHPKDSSVTRALQNPNSSSVNTFNGSNTVFGNDTRAAIPEHETNPPPVAMRRQQNAIASPTFGSECDKGNPVAAENGAGSQSDALRVSTITEQDVPLNTLALTRRRVRGEIDISAMPAVNVLCSECFLETWGQVVAELVSGKWTGSFEANAEASLSTMSPFREAPTAGRKIMLFDTPLVDFAGVDIEIPGHGAIVVWNAKGEAKAFITKVIQLAAVRRYARIDILLCAGVITSSISKNISKLQNALMRQKDSQHSLLLFQVVSPKTLSAAIAHRVLHAIGPLQEREVYDSSISDTRFQERARFLLSAVPLFTASGAIECLKIRALKHLLGQCDVSQEPLGVSTQMMEQLQYAATVDMRSNRGG